MLFAALVIERPPLDWGGFGDAIGQWLRDVGLYAFIWLCLLGLSYILVPEFRHRSPWNWMYRTMLFAGVAAVVLGAVFLILLASQGMVPDVNAPRSSDPMASSRPPPETYTALQKICLSIAGGLCLFAVLLPLGRDLAQKRLIWRRIWAIARLSIKEAWSRRIVWAGLIIPLIYLYADWYISVKPEDQLRNRIAIAYFSMTVLFILTAALLGAFSIPADVVHQTMFTIVTKPVERFEIVLGRFLGFALLLLAQMAVLSVISYVYVARGLTDQAKEESYHARVPLFGNELYFLNTTKRQEGENVGREWNYRSYITGSLPGKATQYAVWAFDSLPSALSAPAAQTAEKGTEASKKDGDESKVRLEFSFDIFRTTTGLEGKGVYCTFTIAKGSLTEANVESELQQTGKISTLIDQRTKDAIKENEKAVKDDEAKGVRGPTLEERNEKSKKKIKMDLFKERGIYQIKGIEVTDYHTQSLEVPAAVFSYLYEQHEKARQDPSAGEEKPVAMRVFVNVQDDQYSRNQLVGMAKADLYVLVADRPFWINFFKGMVCIFMIACLVLGLAVVASTYMSGIVSLLLTAMLCVGGLFLPFIRSLAAGRSESGGPWESMYRLANKHPGAMPLDRQSVTVDVLLKADATYRFVMRMLLNLIPDVPLYYKSDYVGNGFDITWGTLLFLNVILPVAGYVLPWLLLSYYLIKSREIANP
jgi:hypothetical protein